MDTARKDVVKLLANDTADVNKEQDQHSLTESQVFEEEKN